MQPSTMAKRRPRKSSVQLTTEEKVFVAGLLAVTVIVLLNKPQLVLR